MIYFYNDFVVRSEGSGKSKWKMYKKAEVGHHFIGSYRLLLFVKKVLKTKDLQRGTNEQEMEFAKHMRGA
jgi:hypothetical protein